jgi:hypothetical protein
MPALNQIARTILIILLVGIFSFTAWHLYQKQQEKYSLLSFRVDKEIGAVLIPNLDRLCTRVSETSELNLERFPADLSAGYATLASAKNFLLDDVLSRNCLVSWSETDFCIVFNTEEDVYTLQTLLAGNLQVAATVTEKGIDVGGKSLHVKSYNNFLVISTAPIIPVKREGNEVFGNADFIVYNSAHANGARHILSRGYHHQVWEDSLAGPAGEPQHHAEFMHYIPAGFESLDFYGSSTFNDDAAVYFNSPNEGSFAWVDGGIVVIRKDSFCLVVAPQGLEQDLRLLLEEQTLANQDDSALVPYFNIGNFEIMPFTTVFNWSASMQLETPLRYFTTLENYNILANSIPAMRWYIGELQLGNLFLKNSLVTSVYKDALPQRAHAISMVRNTGGEFEVSSKNWHKKDICITTVASVRSVSVSPDAVEMLADFEIEIVPTEIQLLKSGDSLFILVSNANQLVLYDTSGVKKWRLDLTSPANGKPQIIDLENDGIDELAIFQQNQLDVVNASGRSVTGFPEKLAAFSKGGLAVNYDDAFNYRFLVSSGNQLRSYDEAGNPVQGWMFNGMTEELNGGITYYTADGKDVIAFKDINNRQYVISRRGESRLTKEVLTRLPNETEFVIGNIDNLSLRKHGYRNNHIISHYLADGLLDSVKLDKEVTPDRVSWLFNNNEPLLVIEETGRVIVFDAFGYEKNAVLKPTPGARLVAVLTGDEFNYLLADNSQNSLYLLNSYGKMTFPVPVTGSSVFVISEGLLYTFAGTKVRVYRTG